MNFNKFYKNNKPVVVGGGGALLLLGGFLLYKKHSKKGKVIKSIKTFPNATVGSINLIETAQQLGQDLGFAYDFYDPRRWTENDDAVIKTILQVPKSLMGALQLEYAKQYPGRSLQLDCQKLVGDYAKIRSQFI